MHISFKSVKFKPFIYIQRIIEVADIYNDAELQSAPQH